MDTHRRKYTRVIVICSATVELVKKEINQQHFPFHFAKLVHNLLLFSGTGLGFYLHQPFCLIQAVVFLTIPDFRGQWIT